MATISEALAIAARHQQAGRSDLAEEICRRILQAEPQQAPALHLLGAIALQTGRKDEAIAAYRHVLEIDPGHGGALVQLASLLMAEQRLDEAIDCCRRAAEVFRDSPGACYNLGVVLQLRGRLDEAIAAYQKTLELRPEHIDARCNLGTAWQSRGNPVAAADCFQRAIEYAPGNAGAQRGLGVALAALQRADEALACYRRAIQLAPDYAEAYNEAGGIFQSRGQPAEAAAWFWRAVELKPDLLVAYRNYLCAVRYDPGVGLRELRAAYGEFARRHAARFGPPWAPHDNRRDPERPLRVGFVSPRLARGPVGQFLVRALENFDRDQYPTVCYSDRAGGDELTARLQAAASVWCESAGMSDAQLAERIRHDRIDVLFDLVGHAAGSRLLALAEKPAPVQITWIDSVGTTGLAAIDYLVADRHTVPAAAEPHYVERVLRMPDSYVCFDPPADAPPVGLLPAELAGHVRFASFNNPAKIHAGVVDLWARILQRVPGARLVLKYRGFEDPGTQRHYGAWFAARGVPAERLEFAGLSPPGEYLRAYQRVDIALDPFPHNGGQTTCDALWMGVPVVTWAQETFAGRQSLSYLSAIGFTETVASDASQYVERAVTLAHDRARLAAIRAGLREQMAASPLCDGRRFAEHLMRHLREAWRRWCAGV
jgi:predicted O-linked N-acetylglucosamine transferase (SPINDLY family)